MINIYILNFRTYYEVHQTIYYSLYIILCVYFEQKSYLMTPTLVILFFQKTRLAAKCPQWSWWKSTTPAGWPHPLPPASMYPESTTDSPARLSLRQTGSPGMIYRWVHTRCADATRAQIKASWRYDRSDYLQRPFSSRCHSALQIAQQM